MNKTFLSPLSAEHEICYSLLMMKFTLPFITKKKTTHIVVEILREKDFEGWLKKQDAKIKALVKQTGFGPKGGAFSLFPRDEKGNVLRIFAGVSDRLGIYDIAACVELIKKHFSEDFLKRCSFELQGKGDLSAAVIGWGLACYEFDLYKKVRISPALLWPKNCDKKRVGALLESIYLLRNMVNTPANDMSPADIEKVVKGVGEEFKATVAVTKGKTLESEFPLVHMVGKAGEQPPRLIDLKWGKKSDPKLTIVGKGVSFDTGGLNIKPTSYMALMKKDMGGSAHALALARLIMALGVPVQLRVIIPAVENAIAGNAFRPGDIVKSRKGLTVENTNTDAEGRLILADALAYACEGKPDFLIDFATLTGSARAALGPDVPAMFATKDKTAEKLQALSFKNDDPLWRMPLWSDYRKHNKSQVADLQNSASIPGDLIYSALFLKEFVTDGLDWVHIDCHAWELSGKPGRQRGAADTGLLAAFALIEERYA